jgi:NAD(P)-dependent dehydrogenase (short-subunit alcohol dehydrogenase family)
MDVTDSESIAKVVKTVQTDHDKLDVLVNKYESCEVVSFRWLFSMGLFSAGISAPLNEPDFAAKKFAYYAEDNKAPYDLETVEGWQSIYRINTLAPFFVTTAFLGLLQKGARSQKGGPGTSSVINISSVAASSKMSPLPNSVGLPYY